MNRLRVSIFFFVVAAFMAFLPEVSLSARLLHFNGKGRVPNAYIVMFKDAQQLGSVAMSNSAATQVLPDISPISVESTRTLASALSASVSGHLRLVFADRNSPKGFSLEMSKAAVSQLASDPRIDYIEPVLTTHITTKEANAPWDLDRLDQKALPLDGAYTFYATAENATNGLPVEVWVLDTGIRFSHTEFGGRAGTSIIDCSSVGECAMFDDDSSTADCNGHGTLVASLVGGATYGVAKQVTLIGVKVTEGCGGTGGTDYLAGGIFSAIDSLGSESGNPAWPGVIQISVIANGPSTTVDNAVKEALNDGVPVVASAGNGGTDACQNSPDDVSGVIVVGASTQTDQLASFSNFGRCVTVFAPGVDVLGAGNASDTEEVMASGTSVAAPLVSGIVALYLQTHPMSTPSEDRQGIVSVADSIFANFGSGSPSLIANSCVAGNNPTLDPSLTGCSGSGGGSGGSGSGGGSGTGGLSPAQEAAIQSAIDNLLL